MLGVWHIQSMDPPHGRVIVGVTREIGRAPIAWTLRQRRATDELGRELSSLV